MIERFVLPDFLNLGVASPAPRGALGWAPRAKLVPQSTIGTVFAKVRRNRSPMLLNTYLLPLSAMVQGQAFDSVQTNELGPNPYSY